ncbi:MAG: hypothetical protein JWM68_4527 [Verrucomicrobiales bacterium]|nr:hypothetical protein [Verrucomicrobiales bacterium]
MNNGNLGVWITVCGIFTLLFLAGNCSSNSHKTDGVFERATKKIDQGRENELTWEERQRVNDIVNWCKVCDKPLRSCPHGR